MNGNRTPAQSLFDGRKPTNKALATLAVLREIGEASGSWLIFWEGGLIVHFLGLLWALAWCVAWLLYALGFRFGRRAGRWLA